MENPKSSFRGTVSYIGAAQKGGDVLIAIASQEFFVRRDDPGLKYLKVTSGSHRVFLVVEQISTDGLYRICAVYLNRGKDVRFELYIQNQIGEGTLTREMLEDELPDYVWNP